MCKPVQVIAIVTLLCILGSAYLAQSPQLYKQMALCADFDRVFTIGAGMLLMNNYYYDNEVVGACLSVVYKWDRAILYIL